MALTLLWWTLAIPLAIAALLLGRARFRAVLAYAAALRGVGAAPAARWVYARELVQCRRRAAALECGEHRW